MLICLSICGVCSCSGNCVTLVDVNVLDAHCCCPVEVYGNTEAVGNVLNISLCEVNYFTEYTVNKECIGVTLNEVCEVEVCAFFNYKGLEFLVACCVASESTCDSGTCLHCSEVAVESEAAVDTVHSACPCVIAEACSLEFFLLCSCGEVEVYACSLSGEHNFHCHCVNLVAAPCKTFDLSAVPELCACSVSLCEGEGSAVVADNNSTVNVISVKTSEYLGLICTGCLTKLYFVKEVAVLSIFVSCLKNVCRNACSHEAEHGNEHYEHYEKRKCSFHCLFSFQEINL